MGQLLAFPSAAQRAVLASIERDPALHAAVAAHLVRARTRPRPACRGALGVARQRARRDRGEATARGPRRLAVVRVGERQR
jgi:hypothetical protein